MPPQINPFQGKNLKSSSPNFKPSHLAQSAQRLQNQDVLPPSPSKQNAANPLDPNMSEEGYSDPSDPSGGGPQAAVAGQAGVEMSDSPQHESQPEHHPALTGLDKQELQRKIDQMKLEISQYQTTQQDAALLGPQKKKKRQTTNAGTVQNQSNKGTQNQEARGSLYPRLTPNRNDKKGATDPRRK